MDILETLAKIGVGGIIMALFSYFVNKRKENSITFNNEKQGKKLDLEISDYLNQKIKEATEERTKDLRETIVANEVAHMKEIREQGLIWSNKYVTLEQQAERKIQIFEMKIEVMEKKMVAMEEQLSNAQLKLDKEIELRTQCLRQLNELTEKFNKSQNL